jgi:hypothetical protein
MVYLGGFGCILGLGDVRLGDVLLEFIGLRRISVLIEFGGVICVRLIVFAVGGRSGLTSMRLEMSGLTTDGLAVAG